MKYIVTGAAGFIGSHLCARLIAEGQGVVGMDCFTDYYPRRIKEANLLPLADSPGFSLVENSILHADLDSLIEEDDVIFHLAAQAGVRASWGRDFSMYTQNNVMATQMLLEACRGKGIGMMVYASSSSVYGDAETMPTREDALPRPISPYGVSKLAAEHLCYLYWKNFGVPTISLRYFTVYGPRQRPDMAFHRILKAGLTGTAFQLYGTGEQTRDFTYVDDIIEANMAASRYRGETVAVNVGGGNRISMNEVMELAGEIIGSSIQLERREDQEGDVRHTSADISRAGELLGYAPKVGILDGLRRQHEWLRDTIIKESEVARGD